MRPNAPAPWRQETAPDSSQLGMTLIEISLVVVIIGLVVSLGVYSMNTMLDNARLTKTRAIIEQTRDCLIKRAMFNNRYPTYQGDGEIDCDDLTLDVNACFCKGGEKVTDAWGQQLRFLEGIDDSGDGLSEDEKAIINLSGAAGVEVVTPGPDSKLINASGDEEDDVAFIIISYGDDRGMEGGTAFDPSYGNRFTGDDLANFLDAASVPDFSDARNDDLYLMVTAGELRAAVAE